jgi:hypothetical protein
MRKYPPFGAQSLVCRAAVGTAPNWHYVSLLAPQYLLVFRR